MAVAGTLTPQRWDAGWSAASQAAHRAEEARFRARHRERSERRAAPLPAAIRAVLLSSWDEEFDAPGIGSPAARAGSLVFTRTEELKRANVRHAYSEEAISAHAENYATLCGRMTAAEPAAAAALAFKRLRFARNLGLRDFSTAGMSAEGIARRLIDEKWWRRQLRKIWTRASEDAQREMGLIRKGRQQYATDELVEHHAKRQRRVREWMEGHVLQNEEGTQLEMLALADKSLANPALRRSELMCRMRGFERTAVAAGHVQEFWTLTAPSAFHASLSAGGLNPKYERQRVRDAQRWLCRTWAKVRSKLHRLSIMVYGIRVAEPHHDATPHWHVMLFMAESARDTVRSVMRAAWWGDKDYRSELTGDYAREARCKVIAMDPAKGSACGYIAKYIAKNIDGAGQIGSLEDDEGGKVSENVNRTRAWASAHGIRQFQQIGGPPVGLWRECRRVRDPVNDADIEPARSAADRGNWAEFIAALSPLGIAAGRSIALKVEREHLDELNQYGEPRAPRVLGLRCADVLIPTRAHRWRIERKGSECDTPSGTARECAAQGVEDPRSDSSLSILSDLGPVAITVRQAAAMAPDLIEPLDFEPVRTDQLPPCSCEECTTRNFSPFKEGATWGMSIFC